MAQLRRLFGKRVQALLERMKLTQTELGRKLDLDYRYVGGIERGEINLTLNTLERENRCRIQCGTLRAFSVR